MTSEGEFLEWLRPTPPAKPRLRWRHRAWGDWMVERKDGARACAEFQEGEGITIRAEEARLYAFANGEIWP